MLVVVATAGVGTVGATSSAAADEADSAVTVAWNGQGNDPAIQALQPGRESTWLSELNGLERNPHYAEFESLTVTVSKTESLGDEVVKIDVTGMPGATVGGVFGIPGTSIFTPAHQQNFLQVFQCWGDPLADDFRETCQFGAGGLAPNGIEQIVFPNAGKRGYDGDGPLQFRSLQDKDYYDVHQLELPEGESLLSEILSPSTTNELMTVPVKSDGTTSVGFETQTSAQAPWLGCGALDDAGKPRSCSLVVVPRGTVYGDSDGGAVYGESGVQAGSPISPQADYWDNRIVVPLDFEGPRTGCGAGAATLLGGSQLLSEAMGSWQTALCERGDLSFNFTSGADAQSRMQLVQGDVGLAFTSRAVTAEEIGEGGAEILADADLAYAPVVIAALTVSFQYVGPQGPVTDLKLTPRILAKLLTQSYRNGAPDYVSGGRDTDADGAPHLRAPTVAALNADPEFQTLNPQISSLTERGYLGDIVVAGPAGSDGYLLLWEYLQADDKARAFLAGEPDNVLPGDAGNRGMTINPYYLPAGHPDARVPEFEDDPQHEVSWWRFVRDANGEIVHRAVGYTDADGAPLSLAETAIDSIPRADQSLVPGRLGSAGLNSRFDSVAWNPYEEGLDRVAQRVFRGDLKRPVWDSSARVGNSIGGWKTWGRSWPPRVKILGATDNASSERYGLAAAQLQLPNRDGVFASPTTAAMTSALSSRREQADATWPDLAALSNDAYPLTLLTYAAVNLTAIEAETRADFADLIEYAATDGQVPGEGVGQLPAGYAPLTDELRAEALAAAQRIRDYVPPTDDPGATAPPAGTTPSSAVPTTDAPGSDGPGTQTSYDAAEATETSATSATSSSGVLGAALLAGVAGAAATPFLLRRRAGG